MVKICYNLFTTMSFKQFRPGFQQESILLHRGNVENSVENVENTVESRGNNKKLLVQRTFYSVENFAKLAESAGEKSIPFVEKLVVISTGKRCNFGYCTI